MQHYFSSPRFTAPDVHQIDMGTESSTLPGGPTTKLMGFLASSRVWLPIMVGLAVLYVPTLLALSRGVWSTDEQAHGPIVLGGSALFAMALGMGVPLLAVGASAGALLPKAGPWMETVKRFFGTLLLGMAIYLVSPFTPVPVHMMFLWSALLIVSAIFLRAIDPLPANAHGFERFSKSIGVIALIAGIAYLAGALSGSRDVLQPLSNLRTTTSAAERMETPFQKVKNVVELAPASGLRWDARLCWTFVPTGASRAKKWSALPSAMSA